MRFVLTWLSVVVAFGAIYAQARAASPRYSITQLRTVSTAAGVYSNAYDINDNGIVAGSEAFVQTASPFNVDWAQTRAIRWDLNGNPTLLPSLAGYGSEAYAINNLGKAVGASVPTGVSGSVVGAATIFSTTASLIPNKNYARDINDAGLVVGGVTVSVGSNDAFAYNSTTSTFLNLNFGGATWRIDAVSASGAIIGNSDFSGSNPGRPARLSTTAAPAFLYTSTTKGGAVYDFGPGSYSAGQYQFGTAGYVPALFSGSLAIIPTISGINGGSFESINDRTVAVGGTYGTAGDVGIIWEMDPAVPSTPANLVDRVNNAGAWRIGKASSINNRGQIVGQGYFDHDNNSATPSIRTGYRLDPIRSPGDTNYDNVVNFTDLLALAQNYGRTGNGTVFWETGDFNFDWAVNFDDLLTLSQNYSAARQFEADWQLARSLVPEPACVSILSLAICLRSRRRSR